MDMFLLVMPSMLFILLQYTSTTYSNGVKLIESIKAAMVCIGSPHLALPRRHSRSL